MAVSRILSADFSAGTIMYLNSPRRGGANRPRTMIGGQQPSHKGTACQVDRRYSPHDATIPEGRNGPAVLPLFCLAPHGVFRASRIAPRAVSSYLAFSPLPALLSKNRRCLFCDTFLSTFAFENAAHVFYLACCRLVF